MIFFKTNLILSKVVLVRLKREDRVCDNYPCESINQWPVDSTEGLTDNGANCWQRLSRIKIVQPYQHANSRKIHLTLFYSINTSFTDITLMKGSLINATI